MEKRSFTDCFENSALILTEGAVGLRLEREFHIRPDKYIINAPLIYDSNARKALTKIYGQYLRTARDFSLPIMLMTNTRRANRERMTRSDFSNRDVMGDYTNFLYELTGRYNCEAHIGGMVGCKCDAYSGNEGLSAEESFDFHMWQADAFKPRKPGFMIAGLMPCLSEAIGISKALETLQLPYIISLMINREGCLLDGNSINDAIAAIDAAAGRKPLCYMTTCIHPNTLRQALSKPFNRTALVRERFCGIQANASDSDLRTLDGGGKLLTSSPEKLAAHFVSLHSEFPMKIYGGCCGTDDTHLREIAKAMKGAR